MARILTLTLCVLLATSLTAGCTKEDSSGGGGKNGATSSKYKADYSSAHPKFLARVTKLAKAQDCTVTVDKDGGAQHIGEADHLVLDHDPYPTDPPTSGPHFGIVTAWGFYDEQVQDEFAVHNLEHGGVVIWYGGTTKDAHSGDIFDQMSGLLKKGNKVVASPRSGYSYGEFSLTAWRVTLHCPANNKFDNISGRELFTTFFKDVGSKGSPAEAKIPAIIAGTRQDLAPSNDAANPMVALPKPPTPVKDLSVSN